MARQRVDPAVLAHLEWLGFVKPVGLVVSAPALVRAGAILDRADAEGQRLLRGCLDGADPGGGLDGPSAVAERPVPYDRGAEYAPRRVPDFHRFARAVLGWSFTATGYAGTVESPIPSDLEVALPEYGETLRPDLAVREPDPQDGAPPWQVLVRVLAAGEDLDRPTRGPGGLEASAHGRMERLLRQTGVPAGLLFNGEALRLVSAPRGESSGWLDFRVADMVQTAGRPISTAMRLLLGQNRLLSLPRAKRLPALLQDSRKYQNEVSERLAEQVLHALYELLRGFQAANDAAKGELLREALAERPNEVYRSLLTVILRLVFLLYAEERGMLPQEGTFLRHYSLAGLHARLREDASLFPDTMDQRYGAWAQLLVLFRMIHDGATAGAMCLPRRHGVLFDPDRFPFLEGRRAGGARQVHERIEVPLLPDGTIWRALEKLLVLDGERISYRALDVEQIGSVYETMMGFRLETATGRSVAIKSQKKGGAPAAVDLDALLAEPANGRAKWLADRSDRKLAPGVERAVADAGSFEDLHAALLPVCDRAATPDLVPRGAMTLQPSDERRRSGSHYTPRSLTEPIVRTTLEPILARLRGADGKPPRPEQILDLKVLDPAMGSGAFLVEACRQLADALVEAWHAHGQVPLVPPDEDEVVLARRLIAQRSLYGVDRNPVAVDLAKVSLWLTTLARDHALTFVDHALRHGDSLVGLTRRQLEAFHWDESKGQILKGLGLRDALDRVCDLRHRIREAREGVTDGELHDLWHDAQDGLSRVRLIGDLPVAAFFEGADARVREERRTEFASAVIGGKVESLRSWLDERRDAERPLVPFHWEVEFPEVFERTRSGFNAIVGNPPFLGGARISGTLGQAYLQWLRSQFRGSSGQVDLVVFFFRRAFGLLALGGAMGLLGTQTIAKGDSRRSGLAMIVAAGGQIFSATRRVRWTGAASVNVSVIHVGRGASIDRPVLGGETVAHITSFLFKRGGEADPARLVQNAHLSAEGFHIYGPGFTFEDGNDAATSIEAMRGLLAASPECADLIHPYIGGSDMLRTPVVEAQRYVIDFRDMTLEEARKWPQLLRIVENKVRPQREALRDNPDGLRRKQYWWRFSRSSPDLRRITGSTDRLLMHPYTTTHSALVFLPRGTYVAAPHTVMAISGFGGFAVLQSTCHGAWAWRFGGARKDDLSYTPSDCFETYPFPDGWQSDVVLEAVGRDYYEFRAALMVRNDEGLTKTYNRFHEPEERDPGILRLRELHTAMDKAVLTAYGWDDVPTSCEFILDYEEDADEESSDRRKPWRYRWPDDVRDEVLARLLELNADRAREETRSGATAEKKSRPRRATRKSQAEGPGGLFT